MCEMASGEVVPVAVETLPVKPRRGTSVKIEALGGRAGPVVALPPLRISSGAKPEQGDDPDSDDEGVDSMAAVESPFDGIAPDPGWAGPGTEGRSQGEFEL